MQNPPIARLSIIAIALAAVVLLAIVLVPRVRLALEKRVELSALLTGTRELGMKLIIYAKARKGTYPTTLEDPGFSMSLSPSDQLTMQRFKMEYQPPTSGTHGIVKLLVGHCTAGKAILYSDGHVDVEY
jgi:hypothetical protein